MRKNNRGNPGESLFRQIRSIANMTQAELAESLDVTIATLSNWENGKHKPALTLKQLKSLGLLLRGMGYSLYDLPEDASMPLKE